MNFGICSLSIVPCRKEPSSTSEMVTQLLFGETYTIVEDKEDWIQITTNYDNYPCWISAKQHSHLRDADFKNLQSNTLSSELVQVVNQSDNQSIFPITVGATLPNYKSGKLNIGDSEFLFEGQTSDSQIKKTVKELKETAYLFLNAPYLLKLEHL
jgi:gamma-D-glutamyl-L-lysine dipeptidyl-peptidase